MTSAPRPLGSHEAALRNRKPKLISFRYGLMSTPRATFLRKSTSKKGVAGFGSPTQLAAPSRITAQFCGFFVRASFFGGLNGGAQARRLMASASCPVFQPCSSRHPRLEAGVTVVQCSNWRPIMVITQTTPTTGQSLDAIARHQHIANAISTAQWHLAHGRINEATGRIMSAARHLKQACSESTTSVRA